MSLQLREQSFGGLEYTVNVNIDDILRNLSITTIEIPDKPIRFLNEADLSGNWKQAPAPSSTKNFGSKILQAAEGLIIWVPSTIIPKEFNYLINPLHPACKKIKIIKIRDFVYDVRVKKV